MPKHANKFYAIRAGRLGPTIYDNWNDCRRDVSGFQGAVHKSFQSLADAQAWLDAPKKSLTALHCSTEGTIVAAPSLPPTAPRIKSKQNTLNTLCIPAHSAGDSDERSCSNTIPASKANASSCPSSVSFSHHQQVVFDKVKQGENVFFTGAAGTGKSVLLRHIIEYFGGCISNKVAITASTGIAGINIGGTTLHSFAGVGLGKEPVEKLAGKLIGQMKRNPALRRWRTTKVLIIDEISMVDGLFFDKLEDLARTLRQTDAPFGGIQLVVSGDFCQLPPVPERVDDRELPITFAFEAKSWSRCFGPPINLVKVFRQEDQKFVDMLNDLRFGNLNKEALAAFNSLHRPLKYNDGIQPTELFAKRSEVEVANKTRLQALPGAEHEYTATDRPGHDSQGKSLSMEKAEQLLDRLVALKRVELKIGAQVMLIKNLVQGRLVNGSIGKVIGFRDVAKAAEQHTEIAKFDDKTTQQSTSSQELQMKLEGRVWPLVRFANGREVLCVPAEFQQVNALGIVEASRDQIPLILAWALSIHKSQGQTLERVKVDLGRVFESGQAYVALSRATSMAGLQVLNFEPSKIMAHPRVLSWYEQIEHEQHEEKLRRVMEDMDSAEAIEAFFAE